jgi:site-specific DNA-cytosine methylase
VIGTVREYSHFHVFCGLGGGAKGMNQAEEMVDGVRGRLVCLGGVDVDPEGCADFYAATGTHATTLDLFDREQYQDFWGHEPPKGWREAQPADILRAAQGRYPDVVFLSAPCKGFSALLAKAKSVTPRYQALNRLTIRGMWLTLEAFKAQPPRLVVFENVPMMAQRGRRFLDQVKALLAAEGYAVAETAHDCGEIGGLAQTRRRLLLVARHRATVPPFLYQPETHPLRGVGEVLERLPLPGDPSAGPMHALRRLRWLTWVRLALIPAGKDWRALQDLAVQDGFLRDVSIEPVGRWHNGAMGVVPWTDPAGVVTGGGRPHQGGFAVADPRTGELGDYRSLGVGAWEQPAGTVTAQSLPGGGRYSVADPRVNLGVERAHSNVFKVREWEGPMGTITAARAVGGGAGVVADPRFAWKPGAHRNKFRLVAHDQPAGTVIGKSQHPASGGQSVADPRVGTTWGGRGKYRIVRWPEPAGAVIGAAATGNGAYAVADPRGTSDVARFRNVFRVVRWDAPSQAVTAGAGPSSGGQAVADPRPGAGGYAGATGVRRWDEPCGTVAGQTLPSNGAFSVADPRVGLDPAGDWSSAGHYGVRDWEAASGTVTASAGHDNGAWNVADPRAGVADLEPGLVALPGADERCEVVIISDDDTWHRPFTTLELAALQSLVTTEDLWQPDGTPWSLVGDRDTAHRERIGNAVPPAAARAVGCVMLRTLLSADLGHGFMLMSNTDVWVTPQDRMLAIALAVEPEESSS